MVLLCGDPHGAQGISAGIDMAEQMGETTVIFLGDCWNMSGAEKTFGLETTPWSELTSVRTLFLRGNHERMMDINFAREQGVVLPDGDTLEVDGIKFGNIQGIDYDSHKHLETEAPFLYRAIWDSGVWVSMDKIVDLSKLEKCDVLLTHDAPAPFKPISGAGSPYLTDVIEKIQPQFHFGGHMHKFYQREIGVTKSTQLDYIGSGDVQMATINNVDGEFIVKLIETC